MEKLNLKWFKVFYRDHDGKEKYIMCNCIDKSQARRFFFSNENLYHTEYLRVEELTDGER